MKTYITLLLLFFSLSISAQDIFGEWQTINNEGEKKSVVKIYEENGVVYGKIVKINDQNKVNALCTKCEGEDYNKPILGDIWGKYFMVPPPIGSSKNVNEIQPLSHSASA